MSIKIKELRFIPAQGTLNNVTIYESKSGEKKRSSSYPGTRHGADAYFIRLGVTLFDFEQIKQFVAEE